MKKFLSTILLFILIACGQSAIRNESATESSKEVAGWKTYSDTDYSVMYPADWELNHSGQMGTSFILFSPLENDSDKFKENINLIIQNLKGSNISLDKLAESSEQQIKTMISNSSIIENQKSKNQNGEFYKLIYSGNQGMYHLTYKQCYWIINEQAYILTFTCDQKKLDSFNATAEKIMNSFVIKKS